MAQQDEVDHVAISIRQAQKCRSDSFSFLLSNSTGAPAAQSNLLKKTAPFYKFVLTGGPCGGKTTAMARLRSYLGERGFEVFCVPEAYTLLGSNGFEVDYFSIDGMPLCVQNSVMNMQMALEDSFENVLRASGKKAVLLCDRGLCDGAAYMSQEDWDKYLDDRGLTSAEIREGRYNAVFHLVTAAEGAEAFYSLENNEARHETPEEARAVDKKTRAAWVGHPKLIVIDNSTDFESKLNKLVAYVSEAVGLPSTSKCSKKYLLKFIPDLASFPADIKFHVFDVEKTYLYDVEKAESTGRNYTEEYSFIRKRTHVSSTNGRELGCSYGLTTVQIMPSGNQIEVKRIINQREYRTACRNRDNSRHIVKQSRISFIWKTQSFTIHIYKKPLRVENLCICEVQTVVNGNENDSIEIPEFLHVDREISDSDEDFKKYGAFNISLKSNSFPDCSCIPRN